MEGTVRFGMVETGHAPQLKRVKIVRSSKSSVRGSRKIIKRIPNSRFNEEKASVSRSSVRYTANGTEREKDHNRELLKSEIISHINGMSETELEEVKRRSNEIAEQRSQAESKLTAAALKRLEADQVSIKHSAHSRRSKASAISYVSQLEKKLEEEKNARKKLEGELDEIKRMLSTLTSSIARKSCIQCFKYSIYLYML
eukprot:TRINITY_DN3376_c0_g1_i10.p1 TRINITY_DN3376_c0_g1~~TRINITY_DN3376_c0_g1_i10.p1  ORF type:complete len:199 (-),score=31.77 TRINITY_DN3376_c0_g1_i10:129-725(-)